MTIGKTKAMQVFAFVAVVSAICFQTSQAAQSFADTCACPDPAPCPSFCLECNSYDSDCVSGKTQGYCNGEGHNVCPTGYTQKTQQEVSNGVWYCSYSGSRYLMYHCYRECLGITTGQCDKCMDGYYAFNNNQTCNLCEPGHYCTDGLIQGECLEGHYCEAGSTLSTQNECPPGTYGDTTGLTSSICSGSCTAGYYCESGSTQPNQLPCDAGFWGSTGETTASCSGACSAGYYCPEGSSSSKAVECGDASRYCPEGAANYTLVQAGFYSTPVAATSTTRSGEQVCPKGYYCDSGELHPCPAGRYSPGLGATTCSLKCSAGFYCPSGSKSPNANPCYPDPLNPPTHPAEYFCEEGTSSPTQVFEGYYSIPESAPESQRTGQEWADPILYTTRNGKRFRKVEWQGTCTNDAGSINIEEYTNDFNGYSEPGALVLELNAEDNIDSLPVVDFSLYDLKSSNHPSTFGEHCGDYMGSGNSPFSIENGNEIRLKPTHSLDFERCEKFVLEVVAHSVGNYSEYSTCLLNVNVLNINDKPYFPDTNGNKGPSYPYDQPPLTGYSVKERTPKNEGVGSPIEVNDEDEGQEVFFEILPTLDGILNTFYIGSCSGQMYVQQNTLDFQQKNIYQLQIRACDDPQFFGGNASCTVTTDITINVLDINDPPSFAADPKVVFFTVEENSDHYTPLTPWCTTSTNATAVPCVDIDPSYTYLKVDDQDLAPDRSSTTDIMTFTITRNDRDAFRISSCSRTNNLDLCEVDNPQGVSPDMPSGTLLLNAEMDFETNQLYSITIRVNDGRGLEEAKEFEVRVLDMNDPPNWSVSPTSVQYSENTIGQVQDIFASDEDTGSILTYNVVSVTTLGGDPIDVSWFEITAPVSAPEGQPVSLRLTQSVDYEVHKVFIVEVQATDQQGASSNFEINANIEDKNEAPVIDTEILYVPENLPFGTVLSTRIQATDPDNADNVVGSDGWQKSYFSLESGTTSFFTVQTQGNVTTQDPLNYELFTNYTMTVLVRDNGVPTLETEKVITIVVLDEPEPPTIEPGQRFTFTELADPFDPDTMEVPDWNVSVVAYDDDDGDTLTLSIVKQYVKGTAIEVGFFAVDGTNIILNQTHPDIPNYESVIFQDSEEVVVLVEGVDQHGLQSTETVTIEILDTNDRPILTNSTFGVSKHVTGVSPCTKDTYCAPGTVVGNVFEYCFDEDVRADLMDTKIDYAITAGNVADTFEINDGVLRVKTVSAEIRNQTYQFQLTIVATDQGLGTLSSEPVVFLVNVVDVNTRPVVQDSVLNLIENDERETNVDSFEVLVYDLGAFDPDLTPMVYKKVFVSPQDMNQVFEVGSNGTLLRMRPLDFEASNNGVALIEVEVRDNNGEGNWLSNTFRVTINIQDVNEAPTIRDLSTATPENLAAGEINGAILVASDPDVADDGNLRFSFNTSLSHPFTLNPSTGQISQDGSLDYELPHPGGACQLLNGLHVCTLPVIVHDLQGRFDTATLKITVQNINEAPVLLLPNCEAQVVCGNSETPSISLQENHLAPSSFERRIATFNVLEPDRLTGVLSSFSSVTYKLLDGQVTPTGATETGHFRMDATGSLYITSPLDFENKTWHDLRVGVSDLAPSPLSDEYIMRINVTDVNDIGVVLAPFNGPWDTAGGENFTLIGDNFGPTEYKIVNESPNPLYETVEVYLGTLSALAAGMPEMQASGCVIRSHSEITCDATPGGVGTFYYWEVRIGNAKSTPAVGVAGQIASFKRPIVSSVTGVSQLATSGGESFSIHGENFGPPGTPVSARYRFQSAHDVEFHTTDCTVVVHSSVVDCTTIEGVGTNLEFAVTIAGYQSAWFASPNPETLRYRHMSPVVNSVRLLSGKTRMDTAGDSSDRLVLRGKHFGSAADIQRESVTLSVTFGQSDDPERYQGTSCEITVDHVEIQCQYGPGVGQDMRFVVSVAQLRSLASAETLSYLGPQIFSITGPGAENAATKGGDSVVLTGVSFGPVTPTSSTGEPIPSDDLRVYYGGSNAERYEATDCRVTSEQTVIECKTAPGTGKQHAWKVAVSGQESPVSLGADGEGTWYSPPTINKFLSKSATEGETVGGEEIVLEGVDFGDGSALSPIHASFGRSGYNFHATNCSIVPEFKHTRVACLLPPGIGRTLSWVITVDGQSSQVPTSAYKPPVITNITDTSGFPFGPVATLGGQWFAVHGYDFGTEEVHQSDDEFLKVTYGRITGAEFVAQNCSVVRDSPSEVWCKLSPGVGANLKVIVGVWNQKSALSAVTFSYAPPIVSSVLPSIGSTSPQLQLNINGSNFGPFGSAEVTWNSVPLDLRSESHTFLAASVPEIQQRGVNNNVVVKVGGQSTSFRYSFTVPTVSSISAVAPPRNYTGEGPQQILIRGESFGVYVAGDSKVTVNGEPCLVDEWSHSFIACNATEVAGPMQITVGGQTCKMVTDSDNSAGCCPCDFDYAELLRPPKLIAISACDEQDFGTCPTNGGYDLVVYGEDLGTYQYGRVEVNGRPCIVGGGNLNYTSSRITCTVPAGEGSGPVRVYQAWKVTEEEVTFHYDRPQILQIEPGKVPTMGNSLVKIHGRNFGTDGPQLFLRYAPLNDFLGSSIDRLITIESFHHEVVVFRTPPGQGIVLVNVRVADQDALPWDSNQLSYLQPNITSASPVRGSTKGGYTLTISGDNFGTNGTVLVGTRNCPVIEYSHTLVKCEVPAGGGELLPVYIYSGGYESASPHPRFTYDRPMIESIHPNHGPTMGNELLTIFGKNFGNGIVIEIGGKPCTPSIAVSDTVVECRSPKNIGLNHLVVATLDGQSSRQNFTFHYDPPQIDNFTPSPMDAAGGELVVAGRNFGDNTTDPGAPGLAMLVNNEPCIALVRVSDGELRCELPPHPVGTHGISVFAAGQSSDGSHSHFAVCYSGYYGIPGELCSECPPGAYCIGYRGGIHHDPKAIAEWGSVGRARFRVCNPREACLGDNLCRLGYAHSSDTEFLCQSCFRGNSTVEIGYYRLEGRCIECPRLAWLLLVGVLIGAAVLCGTAYLLTKHGVQLAAVSIGIDFAQVCSLFATYGFNWPPLVMNAYSALSAFNLNLELASPECSVGWDYKTKWQIMYFMPPMFAGVFSVSLVYSFIKAKIKSLLIAWENNRHRVLPKKALEKLNARAKKNADGTVVKAVEPPPKKVLYEKRLLVDDGDIEDYDASFNRFVDAEFGAFLIMCYYLYLSVMKKIFEIFNCENGTLVVETSIQCNMSDPVYARLYTLSTIGMIVYGVGIPGGISYLLYRHKILIMRDQHRREASMTESQAATALQNAWRGYHVRKLVNPTVILRRHKLLTNIGRARAKYGKLYEDFTGDCFYWRVLLLLRKLLLVIITMFGQEKYQQTCLAFGVLFISYALQVKHRPYLARYKTKSKTTGQLTRLKSRAPLGFSKVNQFLPRGNQDTNQDRFAGMDSRQYEIDRSAAKRILSKKMKNIEEKEGETNLNGKKPKTSTAAEKRWQLVKHFVSEQDASKYHLHSETAMELGEDMFRWLFDYNSLEALSLGTSMYILLFGMLFDSYHDNQNDVKTDLLAALTLSLFTIVIFMFAASVWLDVYRKFWPKLRTQMPWHKNRTVPVAVAPVKESHLIPEQRGQWVAPVNPFATLASQNANLVRAEERRIAAIMQRKMKHMQELQERERLRNEEKEKREAEYRSRMQHLEAEMLETEERVMEEERALELELEEQARKKQEEIELELREKMEHLSQGLTSSTESMGVDTLEALEHAAQLEFEAEKEAVLAEQQAKEEAERARLKQNQMEELNSAIASLESEAESLFVGRREHQEELKARLWERKMRKPRRKKKSKDSGEELDKEELLMEQLEDKFEAILKQHDTAMDTLVLEQETARDDILSDLKSQIEERVKAQSEADQAFEKQSQKELVDLEEAAKKQVEEIEKKMHEAASEEVKVQFKDELAKLKANTENKRAAVKASILAKRQQRAAEIEAKETAKAEQQAKALEEATQEAKRVTDETIAKEVAEAERVGVSKAQVEEVKGMFEVHQQKLDAATKKSKDTRRVALAKRLEARRKVLESAAKNVERSSAPLAVVPSAKGLHAKRSTHLAANADYGENQVQEVLTPEQVQERLEKIKEEAQIRKDNLDKMLRANKSAQRDKLRERLNKRKEKAEQLKRDLEAEKKREEEEAERKRKEEEEKIRERHNQEIKEIEEARIEVLLDENHAKSLADGVKEWRKRRDDKKKKEQLGAAASEGPTAGTISTRRSSVLRHDFAGKARQLEEMVAEARAKQMEEAQRRAKDPTADASEVEKGIKELQSEVKRHIKDLNTLYKNYDEEVEAEINKLANEAAVEKARQRRKLDMLNNFVNPPSESAAPSRKTSTFISPKLLAPLVVPINDMSRRGSRSNPATPMMPVHSPIKRPARTPGGGAGTPLAPPLPIAAQGSSRLPGQPLPPPGMPGLSPPGGATPPPMMHVNLKQLSLRRLGDV